MTLSIIIPAYQEEENIPYIEEELFPVLENLPMPVEVVFVDDGSTDKTVERIRRLMERRPSVKLFQHAKNLGLGAAIRTGIRNCTGELVVTMDSDLTFHPRQIPALLERFRQGDVDCVIGSPALAQGYDPSIAFYRIFLSRGANFLYGIMLGKRITAVSPIFRLYRAAQVKELNLESDRFEINAEILAKLLMKKRKIAEIPAALTLRKYGQSKLDSPREILNHLKLMSKIIAWRLSP